MVGLTPSLTRVIAGHSGFRCTNDQSMFVYFVSVFAPMLCDGRSHPFYRDSSYCLSLALQVPWLLDALLAVAEHHRALSQDEPNTSALRRYGHAVRGLRESVAGMTVPNDAVLCAATFAGLFEERLSDQGSSMAHFHSSCDFLRALAPALETSRAGSTGRMAFLRQQADLAIYHAATRAIFEPDVQKLSRRRRTPEALEAYLQKIHPGPQAVDPFPTSSFLGPVPGLYTLVHRATLLARAAPLSAPDAARARQCLDRVREIKALLDATSFLHRAGADVANPFLAGDCTPRLYVLALEVMLAKATAPETTAAARPAVQERAHEAHRLLGRRSFLCGGPEETAATREDMSYHLAEPLCWPVLVVGVAARRAEHRATFERVLGELWDVSYNGFVRRVSGILKRVWAVSDGEVAGPQAGVSSPIPGRRGYVDGLDVLVGPNGIL